MFNYTPIFADSALSGTALYNSITVDEHPYFFINQLLALKNKKYFKLIIKTKNTRQEFYKLWLSAVSDSVQLLC